jgi:hypothetical protein
MGVFPIVSLPWSISRRLVQEPCLLRGHRAGFLPILLPSPSIFSLLSAFISSAGNLLRASLTPSHRASLHFLRLLHQPPCCPSSPLSPHLRWCCKPKIAIPYHNLDVNSCALNDICPCLLRRAVGRLRLVGVLSPSTILCHRGFVAHLRCPFLARFLGPLLPLHSLCFHSVPTFGLQRGSSGSIGWRCILSGRATRRRSRFHGGRSDPELARRVLDHKCIKCLLGGGCSMARVHQAVLR